MIPDIRCNAQPKADAPAGERGQRVADVTRFFAIVDCVATLTLPHVARAWLTFGSEPSVSVNTDWSRAAARAVYRTSKVTFGNRSVGSTRLSRPTHGVRATTASTAVQGSRRRISQVHSVFGDR